MYFTYILYSEKYDKFYTGSTNDINKRVIRHNSGGSTYTRPYRPWKLVYNESFQSRRLAIKREKYLKSLKDKKILMKLVNHIPV